MRSRQSVLALLFSTLFTACSTYEGASDVTPLDECPDLDYSTCDTRKVACQAQLLELASCIYGVTPRPRVIAGGRPISQQIAALAPVEFIGSDLTETFSARRWISCISFT